MEFNFLNPYLEIHSIPERLLSDYHINFEKEVSWCFLKNLSNRLKMYKNRINIKLDSSANGDSHYKFGGIYNYSAAIDIEKLAIRDENFLREYLLGIVYKAFLNLGNTYNWDNAVIIDAYAKAKDERGRFLYNSNPKLNPKKSRSASITLRLNGDMLSVFIRSINSLTSTSEETFLIEINEMYFAWLRYINFFGWKDNGRFGLKILDGQIWVLQNFETGLIEVDYNPKSKSLSELSSLITKMKTFQSKAIH